MRYLHLSPKIEIPMDKLANTLIETVSSELVELNEGDLFQVTRIKDRKYKTAPYFCIGKNGSAAYLDPVTKRKIYTEGLDVTGIFLQLSSTALSLFWKLVSIRETKTNVVNLTHFALTNSDKNRLKKLLNELLDHQLVCRIKRGYLLINPKAIIPEYKFYEAVECRWIQLEKERNTQPSTTSSLSIDSSSEELALSLSSVGVMDSPIEFDNESIEDKEFTNQSIEKLTLTL